MNFNQYTSEFSWFKYIQNELPKDCFVSLRSMLIWCKFSLFGRLFGTSSSFIFYSIFNRLQLTHNAAALHQLRLNQNQSFWHQCHRHQVLHLVQLVNSITDFCDFLILIFPKQLFMLNLYYELFESNFNCILFNFSGPTSTSTSTLPVLCISSSSTSSLPICVFAIRLRLRCRSSQSSLRSGNDHNSSTSHYTKTKSIRQQTTTNCYQSSSTKFRCCSRQTSCYQNRTSCHSTTRSQSNHSNLRNCDGQTNHRKQKNHQNRTTNLKEIFRWAIVETWIMQLQRSSGWISCSSCESMPNWSTSNAFTMLLWQCYPTMRMCKVIKKKDSEK